MDGTAGRVPLRRRAAAGAAGRAAGRAGAVWPGLLAVGAATTAAFGAAHLVPVLGASTAGVVLGAVAANCGLLRDRLRPGAAFAARRLLRAAVVLLGLQLALPQLLGLGAAGLVLVVVTVAVTFTGTRLLGRALGVPPARALLVATGFSICGASAVAAVKEVTDADEEDAAVAVALVTLCGTLAIAALPALRGPLGLDPVPFGTWVGASVQDVGQTVAVADQVPGALTTAVVVKLSRVVLLAPLVAAVALAGRRAGGGRAPGSGRRPAPVPLFVAGFLAAIALSSTGLLPGAVLTAAHRVQEVLLVAALVGLGTGVHLRTLRRTGGRAVLLGLGSWVLVAGVAYAGVRLLGA
ncbi:YeiH family protein [Kineococcus sp. SYSU DK005]|uniref:YeiH family protein n=1 Tax=Kineococcus sp. SYSU DK005 TaxID=3383126 RepID=UPI003D7E0A0B